MKIYTGYFANVRKYRAAGLTTVSIARFSPKFYAGARLEDLAPTPGMLKMDADAYDRRFSEILNSLNHHVIVSKLEMVSGGKDVVLLCYESLGKHCHRHLIKDWLLSKGIPCEEFLVGVPPPEKPESVQGFFEFE